MAIYTCLTCGATFPAFPGNPSPCCQRWNTIRPGLYKLETLGNVATPLSTISPEEPRHRTAWPELDELFGGAERPGVVSGHVVLLVGPPGIGKTTLCLHQAHVSERPLILSAEQNAEAVSGMVSRIGADPAKILYAKDCEIASIEELTLSTKATDVFVDSLSCVYDQRNGLSPGNTYTMKEVARRLFDLAHATLATVWLIGHVNAKGKASGPTACIHWCDVFLRYYAERDGTRVLECPSKNRGGPTQGVVRFRMGEKGLTPVREEAISSLFQNDERPTPRNARPPFE